MSRRFATLCLARARIGRSRVGRPVKIATFNVNGVNGRLPLLLDWLGEARPDAVCLQELKAPDDRFPYGPIERAGYGAVWHGQSRWNGVAILARSCRPVETHRGLPGDPADIQSRYIEAAVNGVLIGCLYLPNGNPVPGPKFDYKLAWTERLIERAADLAGLDGPVVLAGDYNIIPTERDVYKPERWLDDALFQPGPRAQYRRLLAQGWTDAIRKLHPKETVYTFWDYWRNAFARDAGIRIDHLLLNRRAARRLEAAGVDRDVRAREKASDHAPVWVELKS
ncbi:MAG: exodeoxyribonuclease [Sphingomonadales bacterium]|nr:exodeoxyribonuclease [Sphingomonadales bacterium]